MVTVLAEDSEGHDVETNVNNSEVLSKMLNDIKESCNHTDSLIDNLKVQVSSGKLNTTNGISLLDVKNQMMLSYLMNINYVIAKKCLDGSIEGDTAVDRLVEIRTVLERIRPLEHKLKYMMEKLVKTALTGVGDENDPTNFKANPNNMMNQGDRDSESEDENDDKSAEKKSDKKSGVYVPPRLAPMHYDEEENQMARRQKQLERAKKRALHSSVVEELREEYLDTPAEVTHGNTLQAAVTRHQKHKSQYEEEYFTRLPASKKERQRGRHSMTVGNIADHLTHFEDIQVLEDESTFNGPAKKKRKASGKLNKKKGFKRRTVH